MEITAKKPMATITRREVARLREDKHVVVHVYPRKKIAVVNGFQYYRLID